MKLINKICHYSKANSVYFVVNVTIEIGCISCRAMTEVNYKFHLQALKKIMRTKRVNIYELALVMDVRT